MEPAIQPFRKETDFPNLHDDVPGNLQGRGVFHLVTQHIPFQPSLF